MKKSDIPTIKHISDFSDYFEVFKKEILKKYAVFSGRTGKKEFWMLQLFGIIIIVILIIIGAIIGSGILLALYVLFMLIPGLAILVRRLHDINKSGWWLLIDFVPIVGMWYVIFLLVKESQPGTNRYGPNPKEVKTY